jgi:hypothetical protein
VNFRKIAAVGGLVAAAAIGGSIALASSAGAATPPGPNLDSMLDTPAYVHYVAYGTTCTPGVTTHTDYKWVPDASNAGPTMWTVSDGSGSATFTWKGGPVAYHRDGTKTQQATDTRCGVQITTQPQAEQLMAQGGVVNGPVDVPQGADVQLRWVDIKGNLSVEGKLSLASSQIEGDATVSGPGAGLSLFNDPGNHFWHNLTVNGAGGYYDGSWINTALGVYSNNQQIDGNLTFTNNTGSRMSLNASMTVNGNFTYSGNALPYAGGLTNGGPYTW